MTRETELAWAAGLFEGEGCITFDSRDARAYARVKMCDPEPLQRFAQIIGVGKLYGPYTPKITRHSDYSVWFARNEEAFAAIALLAPWLSKRRLARLAEVKALSESARPRGPSGWERQRRAHAAEAKPDQLTLVGSR